MNDEAKAEVKFVEVTWTRALKVWWSFTWRSTLYSSLVVFVIGFISVFATKISGDPQILSVATLIIGLGCGIYIVVAVMEMVLKKEWSDFRIALIEK